MNNNVTIVEGCEFPKSDGVPAEEGKRLKQLKSYREKYKELLANYHVALKLGDSSKLKLALHGCMNASELLVCTAVNANKSVGFNQRHTLAEIFDAAKSNLWDTACNELVHIDVAKSEFGDIVTRKFGVGRTIIHDACCQLLKGAFRTRSFQYEGRCYGLRKKAVKLAVRDIKTALNSNLAWAATPHIDQFFRGFTAEGLAQVIPLPKTVITDYVMANYKKCHIQCHDAAFTPHQIDQIVSQAEKGIPEGFALSTVVAMQTLSHISWTGPARLFNWGGRFLILGATKEEVETAQKTLVADVQALCAGTFKFETTEAKQADQPVEFLGHLFLFGKNGLIVLPAHPEDLHKKVGEFESRALEYLNGPLKGEPDAKMQAHQFLHHMLIYAADWRRAFSECSPELADAFQDAVKRRVERTLAKFDLFVPFFFCDTGLNKDVQCEFPYGPAP